MPAGVEVDTSGLVAGMRALGKGLERVSPRVGMAQATETARAIAAGVPVRSGALRATVGVTVARDGAGVTYGGGLPYAGYIEGRAHAVEDGVDGADDAFHRKMTNAAEAEVRRL